jgi:cysteine desulfurase
MVAMSAEWPIYLDCHATTPCDPRVVEAMLPAFTSAFGNAASRQHSFGTEAARLAEAARAEVALLIGASPAEIVFTSGATESNNLAIKGAALSGARPGRHLVTTCIEHRSVLDPCRALERAGFRVTYLPVTAGGLVRVEDVAAAIDERPGETLLVSVMLANNEIGTVQPIGEVGALCKERGVLFHCDAVQALPHLLCDVERLGIDLLSISAHKMYGPKGAGALYVRRRRPHVRLLAQIDGGGHERGLRSGTLNVAGAVGLGAACRLVRELREEESARLARLRDRLCERIRAPLAAAGESVAVHGTMERRLPNNLNLGFPGLSSESLLAELERRGVAVSSGAACSSASSDGSYVLRALGGDAHEHASLRFGLGRFTTQEEVDLAAARVVDAVLRARAARAARPGDPVGCDASC